MHETWEQHKCSYLSSLETLFSYYILNYDACNKFQSVCIYIDSSAEEAQSVIKFAMTISVNI